MEKADILELTVKHLKNMHKQQQHTAASPPTATVPITAQPLLQPAVTIQPQITSNAVDHKPGFVSPRDNYKEGFIHCASEVQRYMESVNSLKPEVKNHISNHLNCRMHNLTSSNTTVTKDTSDSKPIQKPINATYVQILPKDGLHCNDHKEACLSSPVLQGVPCLQPVSVLNGQTIFVATGAIPNYSGTGQLQPVLQLAQPIISNTNFQHTVSSSPTETVKLRMEVESEQDDNGNCDNSYVDSTVVRNEQNNNEVTNSRYRQDLSKRKRKSSETLTQHTHTVSDNLNINTRNNNPKSYNVNSTESNAFSESRNHSIKQRPDSQSYFVRNLNTLNMSSGAYSIQNRDFEEVESKQRLDTRLSLQNRLAYYNHQQQPTVPQGFRSMWRPFE